MQPAVRAALVRGEVIRVPTAPPGRFAVEIDQLPMVIDQMSGDARQVLFGLLLFLSLRGQVQEQSLVLGERP